MAKTPIDACWTQPAETLFAALGTSPAGLTGEEAARRLREGGPNTVEEHRRLSALRLLASQFTSPLILILLFATAISMFAGEWVDALIVIVVVAGSAVLGFWQEYSASASVAKLRARLVLETRALRDGQPVRVAAATLVPGDVIELSAGSLVPADCVVVEAKDFFASQAMLTGESFPVEKMPGVAAADAALGDRANCLYTGSSIRSGLGRAVVVATGADTEFGHIAHRLQARPEQTEFERGIHQFGLMLGQAVLWLLLVVFAANVIQARPALDALLFAVALAVGLAPELLPAIVAVTLSKGAQDMARHGVIVRRLSSIENLGSMDVLCTDKTGTLSEGVIRLDAALDGGGLASDEVLRDALLNAWLQTGLQNPLDTAIQARGALPEGFEKVDEIPYDFLRKRLGIAVRAVSGGAPRLIVKGAVESVLEVCTVEDDERVALLARHEEYCAQGYRVLAVASRWLEPRVGAPYTRDDERELGFHGFLLFFDPPKAGVEQILATLQGLGVSVKLITGDHPAVALHLAHAVGLPAERLITGVELRHLSNEALWHAVENTSIFAQIDPDQKERIIRALRKAGHVVGYLGDGINDAPALRAADVGISVDGAVDVAREAADLVLLEHDLDVLRQGLEQGRRTFANTLKYILTTTSANFGNMLSMAGASLFLPFLPLLAKQILLNNFLSDLPGMAVAADRVDRDWTIRPHRWDQAFLRRFMIVYGLISAVFDYLTFGVLLWIFRAAPETFRTAWFVESLLTELVVALIVRTTGPFYRSRPGHALLWITVVVTAITFVLPLSPLAGTFGFVPLPAPLVLALVAITLGYVASVELAKRWFPCVPRSQQPSIRPSSASTVTS